MSFFKRFFNLQKENPYVLRPERVRVTPLHRIRFVSELKSTSESFDVANISATGLALIPKPGKSHALLAGSRLAGHLHVDRQSFMVSLEIRHVHPSLVGCLFLGATGQLRQSIEKYLEHEILGMKLKKVDPRYTKKSEKGKPVWFSDGGKNELYLILGGKDIVEFHLTFLGNYLEGSAGGPPRFGQVVDDERSGDLGIKPSALISAQNEARPEALAAAAKVIQNVGQLEPEYKRRLLELLKL